MATALKPTVADSLLSDEGVLSLMGQPKMVEAIRALKDDAMKYSALVSSDPELAQMMAALQKRMGEAEEHDDRRAPEQPSDAMSAREAALARAQDGEWARAIAECDRGLRTASGELARELHALKTRYSARRDDEAAAQADEAARVRALAQQELADAIDAKTDVHRLQEAIATARALGLHAEPLLGRAQRQLIQRLEQTSGERMRQMRETARLAAVRAASTGATASDRAPAPAQVDEGVARGAMDEARGAAADAERPASQAGAAFGRLAAGKAAVPPVREPARAPAAAPPPVDAELRALVLAAPMLFELD
ncbi:hypothetical protein KFE25_001559 [Diacronema lutheri]|uniref:Uncharacterized protein n=1 Tax=Diacronema lutheri TaxID=2081491 RepID=A0A8J5XCP4_DIALT|nr:hypothetical protein KFE25_001559 [Diacronema lutheri]